MFLHLGQYHNLYEVLDRLFDGDYEKYLGLDRDLFNIVLRRVSPRITKSVKYVHLSHFNCRKPGMFAAIVIFW